MLTVPSLALAWPSLPTLVLAFAHGSWGLRWRPSGNGFPGGLLERRQLASRSAVCLPIEHPLPHLLTPLSTDDWGDQQATKKVLLALQVAQQLLPQSQRAAPSPVTTPRALPPLWQLPPITPAPHHPSPPSPQCQSSDPLSQLAPLPKGPGSARYAISLTSYSFFPRWVMGPCYNFHLLSFLASQCDGVGALHNFTTSVLASVYFLPFFSVCYDIRTKNNKILLLVCAFVNAFGNALSEIT